MRRGKLNTTILFFFWYAGLSGQIPTYNEDVQPILEKHCIGCHRQGQSGAMPLTNYEEVAAYGQMIGFVTANKLMPPWYADPEYNHMANERVLSASEIQTLRDWIDGEMPVGPQRDENIIPERTISNTHSKKPDLVISMDEAFEQYGIYLDQYQVFVLPISMAADQWVEGIEFIPGNPKIVRYASISVGNSPAFDSLDRWDPRYGYYRFGGIGYPPEYPYWYTWSPLQQATFLSSQNAMYLPANSQLIVAIHYGPTGKPQKDSSSIHLYFTSDPVKDCHRTAPLINPYNIEEDSFYIPAGVKKAVHGTFEVPFDLEITSLTPQSNLLCKSWEIWARIPDQSEALKLLKLTDWNFNWKTTYHLRQPVLLPKGTKLHARALYDNTLDNPCNPAETPVGFRSGSNLFNELFYVHFGYTSRFQEKATVMIFAPAVVSSSPIPIEIMVRHTQALIIQLVDLHTGEVKTRLENQFKKGKHALTLESKTLRNGDYLLRVNNIKGDILAEELLFKVAKGEM